MVLPEIKTFLTCSTSPRRMSSRRLQIARAHRMVVRPAITPVTQILAVTGIAIGFHLVSFSLTAHCGITAGTTRFAMAQVRLERFKEALEKYRSDCGEYPDSYIGLNALVGNPGAKCWNGPYIEGPLRDPWGRPFLYEPSAGVPLVQSLGADGKPGGDLFDSDLSSQALRAPIPVSALHAALALLEYRVIPWLLLVASVGAMFRTCSRREVWRKHT